MAIREEVEKHVLKLSNQPKLGHSMNLFESGFNLFKCLRLTQFFHRNW